MFVSSLIFVEVTDGIRGLFFFTFSMLGYTLSIFPCTMSVFLARSHTDFFFTLYEPVWLDVIWVVMVIAITGLTILVS